MVMQKQSALRTLAAFDNLGLYLHHVSITTLCSLSHVYSSGKNFKVSVRPAIELSAEKKHPFEGTDSKHFKSAWSSNRARLAPCAIKILLFAPREL